MSRMYEIMFLVDNNAVRAGWREAKGICTALIEKHGGKVLSARRWDERKLAYRIRRRQRGTYLLAFCELGGNGVATLRRELDINETVLRYLLLRAESVPPQELELSRAEEAVDFHVPAPPPDDAHPGDEEKKEDAIPVEELEALAELAGAGDERTGEDL